MTWTTLNIELNMLRYIIICCIWSGLTWVELKFALWGCPGSLPRVMCSLMYKRRRPKQEPGLSETCSFPRMSCHHFSSPCLWIFGLLKKEQTKSNTAIFIETIWRWFYPSFCHSAIRTKMQVSSSPLSPPSWEWTKSLRKSTPSPGCLHPLTRLHNSGAPFISLHIWRHMGFLWTSVLTVIQPKTHRINKAITQLRFALLSWPTILF